MVYTIQRGEPVSEDIKRIIDGNVGTGIDLIDGDMDRHETVHQVRKRCKEVRAATRPVRPVLPTYSEVNALLEKGAADEKVLAAAGRESRALLTYDCKDFSDVEDHAGILIATQGMQSRHLRNAVEGVERAKSTLEDVTEYLSDWT